MSTTFLPDRDIVYRSESSVGCYRIFRALIKTEALFSLPQSIKLTFGLYQHGDT